MPRCGGRPRREGGDGRMTAVSIGHRGRTRQRQRIRVEARRALHYAAAVAVVAVWLFPLLWILLTSLKQRPDIFNRIPLFLFHPTLNNYLAVLSRAEFTDGLVN